MSLVELHPEELLDRESSGTLSHSEQEFLDTHLSRCASCRLERQARNDFAEELLADDGHLDVALLVSHAMRAANTVEPPPADQPDPPAEAPLVVAPLVRRTRRPGRASMMLLVAAATLCAGVAAAAWSELLPSFAPAAVPAEPSASLATTASQAAKQTGKPRGTARKDAAAVPSADDPFAEPPALSAEPAEAPPSGPEASTGTPTEPAQAPSEASAHAASHASAAPADADNRPAPTTAATTSAVALAGGHASGLASGPREAPVEAVEGSHTRAEKAGSAARPEATQPTAAALFTTANEALRAGDKGQAQGLYRQLLQLYPASPEARVSRATLGRLLLEQGEGAAALRTFDESLSSGAGAMAEEVMVGRAMSFQRLGDTRGEASAWLALLSTHPGSIHADRARARLAVLSPR